LRQAVIHTCQKLNTSERRTCLALGLSRSSLRYQAKPTSDDELRLAMIRLAKQFGRYGYRKVTALLRIEGWRVNHKKIERLWGEEGLQLPHRHKKRRRLYHQDSSVIRLRPTHPNNIWAIDFVLDALHPVLMKHGKPEFIRSDNGPEFVALHFQDWLKRVGIQPLLIYPGSPWENGYNERFNGTLRREMLNAEWFHSTKQAQVAINTWLRQYNQIRPHHALGMRPPVPETLLENDKISGTEKWS
jgi:putative transposase